MTDYGADPTGVADSTTAIQNTINNTPSGEVAYIPAGTYKLTASLTSKANVTVRGDGIGLTILKPSSGSYGNGLFNNSGDYPDHTPTITITSGGTKGSTSVTVNTTTGAAVNKLITVSARNPVWVHYDASLYGEGPTDDGHDKTRILNSTHYITNITGTTITFSPPLPFDMSDTPMITPWTIILNGFGIEGITFDLVNGVVTAAVYWSHAYGCWLKNVEVKNASSRQLWAKKSINCEIRECYFHDTSGSIFDPNHEGLDLVQNDCFWLIEDNIFARAGKPQVILGDWGGGCNGNVIAYNYFVAPDGTGSSPLLVSIGINHGPHNLMNLIEGNVAQSTKSDGYYGSASHDTFLRNYSQRRLYRIPMAVCGPTLQMELLHELRRQCPRDIWHRADLSGQRIKLRPDSQRHLATWLSEHWKYLLCW